MKLRTGRRTSKVKASKRQGSQGKSCEQRRKLRFGSSSGYNLHDSDAEEKEEDGGTWREPIEVDGNTNDTSGSETGVFEEKGQPVFDLDLGSSSDSQDSSDDENDEDVMANIPDHLSQAVRGEGEIESSVEDSEEEIHAKKGYSDDWGRRKVSYYDADTADLEIGQDFEDAEEEEMAALEAQRAEAMQWDEADLWDMEEGNNDSSSIIEGTAEIQHGLHAKSHHPKRSQQYLDHLMMSEAPELLGILSSLKSSLSQLIGTIDPLCRVVTEDIGTSKDGLQYLASGEASADVKRHPVMLRLMQLKQFSDSLKPVDGALSAQVELLKDAIQSGINFNQKGDGNEAESDVNSTAELEVHGKGKEEQEEVQRTAVHDEHSSMNGTTDSESKQLGAKAVNTEIVMEENDFLDKGVVNEMRKNAAQKRQREVHRIGRRSRAGDFGDDDATYEAYRQNHLVGVVNPVQAAANRAMQKTSVGPRSRSTTGGDTEVEYAKHGQRQFLPKGDWQHDATVSEDESMEEGKDGMFDDEEEAKQGNMKDFNSDPAEYLDNTLASKAAYKAKKLAKYNPGPRIAGTLQDELDAKMEAFSDSKGLMHKRAASYTIVKNRGLIPHKNKANRNPRVKKRIAYRKALIRRKGQVRDMRHPSEAAAYGGEGTGIRTRITRGRKL